MSEIPDDIMQAARTAYESMHPDYPNDWEIEIIARAILAERERWARYHENEIARLEAQIESNSDYDWRSGKWDGSANEFCRSLIVCHRISAATIRGGSHE